ncbi:hypothetical protein N5C72_24470 [Achromobacter mucicolens]|jgi:ACR3 family arsenite efflux pump ArsB|uniref:Uncharacterized protein n=1 Tax=Achromobacter mucicolens TaxID=1389922 RepID=A0ABD4Z0E3_9BURK|nr:MULTISPECIES: hypothetical protein [Achromobacter]MDH1181243.1 hypothetical protein [Achromobacter mucicolens]CAB3841532.1 hypothetical protein LMG3415_01472 [Achromobacter mucicolens]
MTRLRDWLERHQISIYLLATFLAALTAYLTPATTSLDAAINPALALMLFVTFLRAPKAELGRAFTRVRFLELCSGRISWLEKLVTEPPNPFGRPAISKR